MSETEEENPALLPKSKELTTPLESDLLTMDLDIDDLESSWTFDQIFDQAPSFVLSGSDQPLSPLWPFPDDKLAGIGNSMFAAGFNLIHFYCNLSSSTF